MEPSLLAEIYSLVLPFALGEYVDDWQYRAAKLSAISDFCSLSMKETAFFLEDSFSVHPRFLSSSPLRKYLMEHLSEISTPNRVNYSIEYEHLTGWQFDSFDKLYGEVDSSERIVMSACAHAICNLAPPLEITLALCNLFYEEALHLESISTLLGINQSQKQWISSDKLNHWNLVSNTKSITEYLFLEHCLYEGRGFIAAANGVYGLSQYGKELISYKIARFIFEQETNHVLTGYFWLKQLDNGNLESTIFPVLKEFLQTESLSDVSSFKGKRQRFPLFLLLEYFEKRNYWYIRKIVLENAKSIIACGNILITDKQLVDAEETCYLLVETRTN